MNGGVLGPNFTGFVGFLIGHIGFIKHNKIQGGWVSIFGALYSVVTGRGDRHDSF